MKLFMKHLFRKLMFLQLFDEIEILSNVSIFIISEENPKLSNNIFFFWISKIWNSKVDILEKNYPCLVVLKNFLLYQKTIQLLKNLNRTLVSNFGNYFSASLYGNTCNFFTEWKHCIFYNAITKFIGKKVYFVFFNYHTVIIRGDICIDISVSND